MILTICLLYDIMETKAEVFCFQMKDRIIDTAIESLRNEGLKFSVDTIASKLKISKKTIYKFFPDKEHFAYAIYEKYYSRVSENIGEIEKSGNNIKYYLMMIYRDACFMIRSEIFNKYKLNDCIYSYVMKQQNELWSRIISLIAPSADNTDEAVFRAIIEGTFENAEKYSAPSELIVEKLVKIL